MSRPALGDLAQTELALDDGRAYRWSRLALTLDDRQIAAVDRAILEAEKTADRSDAETIQAVAEALREDGFEDNLTGEGFLLLKVRAARTGVQTYSDGVRTWGELRSEDEVGADESLASWGIKPFTDDHPPELVTPDNYTKFVKGSLGQDALLGAAAEDGNRYVEVTILVGDLATLAKIRGGKLELSAGYTAVMVEEPGTAANGDEYRYRQTQIRINHLALVDAGRAGPLAAISLDGGAWEVSDSAMPETDDQDQPERSDDVGRLQTMIAMAFELGETVREATPEAAEEIARLVGLMAASAVAGVAFEEEVISQIAALTGYSAEEITAAPASPEPAPEPTPEPEAAPEPESPPEPDPEAEPEDPAPDPEPETPEEEETMPEEEDNMVAVALTDDLTVQMTPEQKTTWDAKQAADAEALASEAKTHADAEAEKAQAIEDHTAKIADLEAHRATVERDLLVTSLDSLCPALTTKWAAGIKAKTHTDTVVEMKRAAIVDLDPEAADDLTEKMAADDVDRIYNVVTRAAARRKSAQDSGDNPKHVVSHDHNTTLSAAYGAVPERAN